MNTFNDKITLITGASRGIGQSILHTLGQQGYYVIGTATTSVGADAINAYINEHKLNGRGVALDITDKAAIDGLMSSLADEGKVPSILINNAGVTDDDLLLRMSDEAWDRVIETNLTGIFRMSRSCIKNMFRARWGRIVNIGSVVGSSGNAGQTNYVAAKAGVVGFSKALAQEMASRNITVNVVAPGFIQTDMTDALPDMVKDEMRKRIPMKRFGAAEDVALAVAFLVSEGASYITGQTIHVNGGMYMD